jgi:hypothetical protein
MIAIRTITTAVLLFLTAEFLYADNGVTYFDFASNTGNNATVVIPKESSIMINGTPIVQYDEIGVFTPDGLCVGAVVWHPDSSLAITVWGNNENTSGTDGIQYDEEMQFRIWQQSTNTVYGESEVEFIDHPFASRTDGKYRIDGRYVVGSVDAKTALSVEDLRISDAIPENFSLYQNYPNPFNPETIIRYSVAEASVVRVTVHNLVGQEIQRLIDGFHQPGHYEVIFSSEGHASGIYLYRMEAKGFSVTKKFILLQ